MRQRLTAWMALLAMLTGIAMPAHAWFGHARTAMPGEDFCTTVKPAEAASDRPANAAAYAPAAPEPTHAVQCDTCCGCGSVAAAPASPWHGISIAAALAVLADLPAAHRSAVTGFALARGPPART